MPRAQIIFDFDNTLFDTVAFKRDLVSRGIELSETSKLQVILPVAQAAKFDLLVYVYPGVGEVLSLLRASGFYLTLFSYGEPAWQKWKIDASGLPPYFDQVGTVEAAKELHLEQLLGKADCVYFVNDNWQETQRVRQHFPEVQYVLKVREDHRRFYDVADVDIPYFTSYRERSKVLRIFE